MRVDVEDLMTEAITVCNRSDAEESGAEDSWQTANVQGFWAATSDQSRSGYQLVPSRTVKVQIAECDAEGYVEPYAWAGEGWTLRLGDKIVLGSLDYTGDLAGLLEAAEGMDVATITKVQDLRLESAGSELTGLAKWASVLYINGEV